MSSLSQSSSFDDDSVERGEEGPTVEEVKEETILLPKKITKRQLSIGMPYESRRGRGKKTKNRPSKCWKYAKRFVFLSILLLLFFASGYIAQSDIFIVNVGQIPPSGVCKDRFNDPIMSLKSSSTIENLQNGAVASDHPVCSKVGLSILQDYDGNAVDAAVATALCLGVANPSSSGIGGGAFILIYSDKSNLKDGKSGQNGYPKFHDARDHHKNMTTTYNNNKVAEVIDCREVAGSSASTGMFQELDDTASTFGGLAVGVPGELRGLELAHTRYGKLPWSQVVKPAMEMARDGVPVNQHLAQEIIGIRDKAIKYMKEELNVVQQHSGGVQNNEPTRYSTLRPLITSHNDWKTILKQGDLIKNGKLSQTLQAVMGDNGADALYMGDRAEMMSSEIRNAGGIVTKKDIESYYPTIRTPLMSHSNSKNDKSSTSSSINGYQILGVPPPSSGGAAIIGAARFLSYYKTPLSSTSDTLSVHRVVEALRHAFAIRMSLSDPAFDDFNNVTKQAVTDLTSGSYMQSLKKITKDNTTLALSKYGGKKFAQLKDTDGTADGQDAKEGDRRRLGSHNALRSSLHQRELARPFGYLEDHGTSHLSVVDKDGNAVAITTTVNTKFGSCFVSESTGVVFNSQMDDFANPGKDNHFGLKPSPANFIKPGKKPLSSMSPTMIFRQREEDDDNNEGTKMLDENTTNNHMLGDLILVLGASGGPKIISAVLQVFIHFAIFGKPLFESMAHPRIHDQLIYHGAATTGVEVDLLTVDKSGAHGGGNRGMLVSSSSSPPQPLLLNVSSRTRNALLDRGHHLFDLGYTGCVQAVALDHETKTLSAVADIRKGGLPAGY